MANDFFHNNIKNKEVSDNSKQWHKSLQTFCNYKKRNGILNLINGPIADTS